MSGSEQPSSAGVGPGRDEVYGRLRVGAAELALPLSALREVVPRPAELAAMPVSVEAVLGAMQLRSLVVPVLDLRTLLGVSAGSADRQVVVVIGTDDGVLGLVADEVLGITSLPPADLLEMRTLAETAVPPLLTGTFRSPDGEGVVGVLDPDALLSLPGVPIVQAAPLGAGAGPPDPVLGRGRTLTLLRCGSYLLGLDPEHIHMLVPALRPAPSVLSGGACMGVTTYDGREVPVLDPLALLGLGTTPSDNLDGGLVIDLGTGYVVLAITSLLDLVELPAEDVLPVPAFAVPRPDLLAGLADVPRHGQCLVVAGTALVAEPELVALAGLNTLLAERDADRKQAGGESGSTAPAGRTYLVYSAGTALVTPLEQVVEIVPLPDTLTVTQAQPALLGVVVHRQAAVPVLCLATLLGHAPQERGQQACALLVHVDGEPVAFVVEALRSIESLTWQDEEQVTAGGPAGTREELLHRSLLVQVGNGGQLLPDLDLQEVGRLAGSGAGRRVQGGPVVPAPRPPLAAVPA